MEIILNNLYKGRLSRSQFVLAIVYQIFLLTIVCLILALPVILAIEATTLLGAGDAVSQFVIAAVAIIIFLPLQAFVIAHQFGLIARRLHDLDKSGYYSLVLFVPFLNFALIILLLLIPGTDSANTYGQSLDTRRFWEVLGLRRRA